MPESLSAPFICLLPCAPPQLSQVREEASSAKAESGRARAEAEFERERAGRLAESIEMQRQQVESMIGNNAKYQVGWWAGGGGWVGGGGSALCQAGG